MGQVEVGGAAITEAMSSFDGDSDKVSKSKAQNVAKALAWTIAKGGADLTIFKAVDFVSLETRTKTFFRTFFPHLCIALHTSSPVFKLPKQVDRLEEDVEELFSKTLGNSNLAQGLAYFMKKDMGVKALAELDDAQSKLVEDCLKIARNVLARAV
jgi:nucleolar MIF4G domain-containing protein 1